MNVELPSPLTRDEEKEVINRIIAGDTEAKKILVERNLRLIPLILKKFKNTEMEYDDLFSSASIGLIKAVHSFKPDHGTKFTTYATRCIENQILQSFRKFKKNKIDISFDQPINYESKAGKAENTFYLSDILGSTDIYEIENRSEIEAIKKIIKKCLSKREQCFMRYRFGINNINPLNQKSISKLMGLSQPCISIIQKRCIKKILTQFKKEGL